MWEGPSLTAVKPGLGPSAIHDALFSRRRVEGMSIDSRGLTLTYQNIPNTMVQLPFLRTSGSIESRRER
jgi:hypothetical protein